MPEVTEGIRRGVATAEATVLVRDLCNHPANVMTPGRIVQEAKAVAKEPAVKLKVLEQKDMEQLGMGALLGVAKGSHEPPKFIILEYKSAKAKKAEPPVVLVGKTITFDTGGISLKPAENMEHMKADMTGGAEVLYCAPIYNSGKPFHSYYFSCCGDFHHNYYYHYNPVTGLYIIILPHGQLAIRKQTVFSYNLFINTNSKYRSCSF